MSDVMANNKTTSAGSALDGLSGKALSRARRAAMSSGGKAGLGQVKTASIAQSQARIRPAASVSMPASAHIAAAELPESASGCTGKDSVDQTERSNAIEEICSIVANEPDAFIGQVGSAVRQLCQQRRRALSSQGKTAVKSFRMMTPALGSGLSGRAAARTRRAALCENGRGDDPACRPSGRVRTETAFQKVEFGTTLSGNTVSGNQVERTSKVTGTESSTCRPITGTEYIGAEQYAAWCASTPAVGLVKVAVGATSRGQRVSGVDATHDHVTGTKVAANKAVTGNEYLSVDKLESAGQPWHAPAKVGISATRAGMNVSGTEVGRSIKVTGDEHGSCLAISGIQYSGSEQFDSFCDATQQAASRALLLSRGARAVSGIGQMTKGKITGAAKGADMVLSGTPYSSTSQRVSERGANTNPHPLTRVPANILRESAVVQLMPTQQGSFSVVAPARSGRSAQQGNASGITGTAYGSTSRVTGPVNLGVGLVSGTPEFRHQDSAAATMVPARAAEPQAESARNRVSGDGREGGRAITGAAWRHNEHVTGTEGNSTHRNPTIRGAQRSAMPGAAQMKEVERPELLISKVTGSSGTDMKGSSITYSGGARG